MTPWRSCGGDKQRPILIVSVSRSSTSLFVDQQRLSQRGVNENNLVNVAVTDDQQPRRLSMKLGCLYIRSVRNKTVVVNDVFSDHKLDVLALTETWHEESSDTCLAVIIPPGGSIVEQAWPVSHKAVTSDSFINHSGFVCLAHSSIKMTKINLPHKPVSLSVVRSATIWKFDLDIYPVYYIQARIQTTKCTIFLRSVRTSRVIGYIFVSHLYDTHVNDSSNKFMMELEGLRHSN